MASLGKRRTVHSVLAAVLVLGYCATTWGVEFAGGTGMSDDPYQIVTAEQLTVIGFDPALLDKHFVLVNDIDLDPNLPGGQVFPRSPIAPYGPQPLFRPPSKPPELPYGSFTGVFDGDGHIIRNMVIHAENEAMAGLFGHVSGAGEIRDLGLEGIRIQRSLAGDPAFVSGCLVGVNEGGTILRCYATGIVAGPERIAMPARKGEVKTLDASNDEIGGLVGVNNGLINTCYALVDVSGTGPIGGLIGTNSGGLVYFSFSAGQVRGTGWPGGLVGRSETSEFSRAGETILANPGTAIRCFWDIQASGILDSAAGEGRTTAEMMSGGTYTPWMYTGVWWLLDGHSYPRLRWELGPMRTRGGGARLIGTGQFGYAGGSGGPNDPYRIETTEQFLTIGCHPEDFDKSFVLAADLDFNDVEHSQALPIGFDRMPFNGRFDGGSHSLSNLTISQPRAMGVGVFGLVGDASVLSHNDEVDYEIRDDGSYSVRSSGQVDPEPTSNSVIKNLSLRDVSVVGRQHVGGLIGLGLGEVTNCSVSGQVTGLVGIGGLVGYSLGGAVSDCRTDVQASGDVDVGGLVGMAGPALSVLDCQVDGIVMGQVYTGGLIGQSFHEIINRCAVRADVYGRYNAGGLLGAAYSPAVAQSYCVGAVTGQRFVGGFAGDAGSAVISDSYCWAEVTGGEMTGGFTGAMNSRARISRCYAVSPVTASDPIPQVHIPSIGGFAGYASKTGFGCVGECPINITGSFWDIDVSGRTEALGNRPSEPSNVLGLPTAQMQITAPFLAAGWDFRTVWMICEGRDYPRLRWEGVQCDVEP